MVLEPTLESLMCQVAGDDDTKTGDSILKWTEVLRLGHESSRYYPKIAREVRSGSDELSIQA